eukprot:392648-Pyramimonas_sp.AAC.1
MHIGCAQNEKKLEATAFLMGKNSGSIQRRTYADQWMPGRVLREARYLGPMLHYRGYTGVELNRRIQACKKN